MKNHHRIRISLEITPANYLSELAQISFNEAFHELTPFYTDPDEKIFNEIVERYVSQKKFISEFNNLLEDK